MLQAAKMLALQNHQPQLRAKRIRRRAASESQTSGKACGFHFERRAACEQQFGEQVCSINSCSLIYQQLLSWFLPVFFVGFLRSFSPLVLHCSSTSALWIAVTKKRCNYSWFVAGCLNTTFLCAVAEVGRGINNILPHLHFSPSNGTRRGAQGAKTFFSSIGRA